MHTVALADALLKLLDDDPKLHDEAKLLVYAAFEGPDELAQALDGHGQGLPTANATLSASGDPAGAYLTEISVTGFRGVGACAKLPLIPGPGLTVVAGRNGSGKSSFAEGCELALTGRNKRWERKDLGKEWRSGWRNLHHPTQTSVEVGIVTEGGSPAAATVRCHWDDGADLEDAQVEVVRRGVSPAPLDSLGWDASLVTFRPFLSYNELGEVLTGKQSELHDALRQILGLGRITDTHNRLKEVRLNLETQRKDLKNAATHLAELARQIPDDPRAATLATLISNTNPDLDVLQQLIAPVDSSHSQIHVLSELTALRAPGLAQLTTAAAQLREAAETSDQWRDTDSARALADISLLDQALQWHTRSGDNDCYVCGAGRLDARWRAQAEQRIATLQAAAAGAIAAQTKLAEAQKAAKQLVTAPPPVLYRIDQTGLDGTALAVWKRFEMLPDDPYLAADHLEKTGAELSAAVTDLAKAANFQRIDRQDSWAPLVAELGAWLAKARPARSQEKVLRQVQAATSWMQTAANVLANSRLDPLAEQSAQIWEQLRQESNVKLGPVRLEGSANRRRVSLDVTVDDAAGSALGVMSQGELHALALSLFLPRATVPDSPFRFLVIDDPVQAMDPAKVDGLAQVLAEVARTRQVVVFTHDDRLPAAIRRLQLDAKVLQVDRAQGSAVQVAELASPAARHLSDAHALSRDPNVPPEVAATVVPGLCRLALDAACVEKIRTTRLRSGARHLEVERLLEESPKLIPRLALALFDDSKRTKDVLPQVNKWGRWAGDVVTACNKGAHGAATSNLLSLVDSTRQLVRKIS